jgi:uncharacterized protein YhhL (DUF1145 family)
MAVQLLLLVLWLVMLVVLAHPLAAEATTAAVR